MAKNRRKKRRKRRGGQAAAPQPQPTQPSGEPDGRIESRPDAIVAGATAESSVPHKVGDIVSGTVTGFEDDGLWLDVDDLVGGIPFGDLALADGESAQERYAVGETIDGLFVWQVNHEFRILALSVKRNAPGYVEALQRRAAGDVVSGIVTNFSSNGGFWLDVDGLVGSVAPDELALNGRESARERYAVGETIDGLLVQAVNHKVRDLRLSVKRNAPGYVKALQRRAVGDVVSGTITVLASDGGLWLDVDGLVGSVEADELTLAGGESTQERYAVGETIDDLFVWGIDHEDRVLRLSAKRGAPGYAEVLRRHVVGDVVSATITGFNGDDGLWLDVDGLAGGIPPGELALADGESARDRYAIGDTIDGLFVWDIDHQTHHLGLSVKRNAPGYVEALQRHAVGEVVSATVTGFEGSGGLWLNVDGLVGGIPPWEIVLADGESARERYAVGETIEGLFVWGVDHNPRGLALSLKRNAPGYLEALQRRTVGDVVSATITGFEGSGGLWLDVDGLAGGIPPGELALADGESARDRYAIGDTIDGLFVLLVDHEARDLHLSVKRNTPGYMEALQRRTVGDVVSATVTVIEDEFVMLDVDGLVGGVSAWDLDLADGESARERYAVGETIEGLFVWGVDHNARGLALSLKRNAPGYLEALQRRVDGEAASGPILLVHTTGLAVEVYGLFGLIPASELPLEAGQSPQQQYSVGETIAARVWMIDRVSRMVILSARRTAADVREEEPIAQGATIHAVVRGTTPRDVRMPIRVLTPYNDSGIEIPPHALSLSTGIPPRFEDNQAIRVVVVELDDDGLPARLSHRQALDGWDAEMRRLSHNVLVPNARPMPPAALSDVERRAGTAAVDLGPITGVIPEDELDRETGRSVATYNETYRVVVESVDYERRIAIVSHDRFEERWRELAADFDVGAEVAGELREVEGRIALLDLGSGLIAEMPVEQLSTRAEGDGAGQDRIGDTITVRIKSIETATYTITVEIKNYDLIQMIAADETLVCELKKVFLASVQPESPRARRNRQDVNRSVVRAMAGMMNRDGGHVIVGVEDTDKKDGDVVGWAASGWENQNAMATALSNLVGRVLSAAAGGLFEARFERLPNGHEILDIVCKRADEPIFLSDGQREEFPVRFPAMTKNLAAREQHEYIQGRFYGRSAAG